MLSKKKGVSFKENIKRVFMHRYKVIFFDDSQFKEVFSFRHRLMNFVLITIFVSMILIVGTIALVKYTSLREYVFDNDLSDMKREAFNLENKIADLEKQLENSDRYIQGLRYALTGEIPIKDVKDEQVIDSMIKHSTDRELRPSKVDSSFRQSIEDRYLSSSISGIKSIRGISAISSPVRGAAVSKSFSLNDDFLSTELMVPPNTPISSSYSGVVIYKEWTPLYNNVVIVQHTESVLTIYKNLATSKRNIGEKIYQNELLGLSGDKPIIFELWIDGSRVDPEAYINLAI